MQGYYCSKNIQRLKYITSDFIAGNIAFFLFNIIRYLIFSNYKLLNIPLQEYLASEKLILEQILIPFVFLALYWLSGFYNEPFQKSRLQELFVTAGTSGVVSLLIYLLFLTNDQLIARKINYTLIIVAFASFFIFLYSSRLSITMSAIRKFKARKWKFTTLIIGNSEKAHSTYQRLRDSDFKHGYEVLGFVKINDDDNWGHSELPVYNIENIKEIIDTTNVDQLILCPDNYNETTVLKLIDKLFQYGKPLKITPDTLSVITSSIRLQDIFGEPFVDMTSPVIGEMSKNIKRTFDVFASAIALITLSPLLALIAIAVRVDSKGPVIYSQTRIGRLRKPFKIYKFRTMVTDAEAEGPKLSSDNDTRITGIGHVLRKYRLDELPQFFNVLTGEMSIVGPRPEREFFIKEIVKKAPYYSLVHQVRPGITSWGMVKFGYASNIDEMVSRTIYDLIYLSNMSLTVDAKIMIYTIRTILRGSGK